MPKKLAASIGITAVVIMAFTAAFLLWPKQFRLEDQYYGQASYHEISADELQQLISEKKSFALFIYQPNCRASEDFENKLTNLINNKQIILEKIAFSNVKNTGLVPDLKYYPSLAIYHNGKLVNFLRTNADEDTPAYESEDGLVKWWEKYIK